MASTGLVSAWSNALFIAACSHYRGVATRVDAVMSFIVCDRLERTWCKSSTPLLLLSLIFVRMWVNLDWRYAVQDYKIL